MAILSPTPISTKRLTYLANLSMFVADDSDLPRPSRVYDDACDEGYTLISYRTGAEIVFGLEHVERDGEGDILYWEYKPVTFRPMPRPGHRFLGTLRVFNDEQFHTYDGDGDPITIRVGPMGSAVAYAGHIAPEEIGPLAVPPSEKPKNTEED